MANYGAGLYGAGLYPPTSLAVKLRAYLSTTDVSLSPVWSEVTSDVRAFSITRGRGSELEEVDAGTATITLNNRTRAYDPTVTSTIRPMNRWKLQAEIAGTLYDLFVGYADSYKMGWPAPGFSDAVCTVSCTDEFKVLALGKLPQTDPPGTHIDVVKYDQPSAYWSFTQTAIPPEYQAEIGPTLAVRPTGGGALTWGNTAGLVVGDEALYGAAIIPADAWAETGQIRENDEGDWNNLNEATIAFLFQISNTSPAGGDQILRGPLGGGNIAPYRFVVSGGNLVAEFRNDANTLFSLTKAITADTTYHVVAKAEGGTMKLRVNNVQVASTAWTGPFPTPLDTSGADVEIGESGSVSQLTIDEIVSYRYALSDARCSAHYTAFLQRGFARAQLAGVRAAAVLTAAGSTATSSLGTGSRQMVARYMRGQPPLDELRLAAKAELPDGMLFIARDGTIKLLDAAHRTAAPYTTVQATFDDDGTDTFYADVEPDYSETFLKNTWRVTRTNGLTKTATDATSVAKYFERAEAIDDMPITSDVDAQTVADALLAKYKNPMTRLVTVSHTIMDNGIAGDVLPRDLGDRVRIVRTPPGGGARIDQTAFIQRIQIDADNSGQPWTVQWAVTPL